MSAAQSITGVSNRRIAAPPVSRMGMVLVGRAQGVPPLEVSQSAWSIHTVKIRGPGV